MDHLLSTEHKAPGGSLAQEDMMLNPNRGSDSLFGFEGMPLKAAP